MPVSPTQAQSAASRANGALTRGPTTPEGKARSALNGTRHGLRGSTFALLPDEDPAAGRPARRLPRPPPSRRRRRAGLRRAPRRLRLARGPPPAARDGDAVRPPVDTTEPDPRLGWSRTLPRYQAAIRRDRKEALEQLETLRSSRPRLPADPTAADAARLRWVAERIERRLAATPRHRERHARTRGGACGERSPSPGAGRAAELAPRPPSTSRPNPSAAPAGPPRPPLNREQRRRLAALARRVQPGAVSSSVCAGSP